MDRENTLSHTLENAKLLHDGKKGALKIGYVGSAMQDVINAYENHSASIIKLESFEGKYLYIVKYLDKKISQYLIDSQEAVNFYYTVLNKQTDIPFLYLFIWL